MIEQASRYRGKVDIAVITVRADEHEAVVQRLSNVRPAEGRRHYTVGSVATSGGRGVTVFVLRLIEPGNGPAQDAARDLIDDLHPNLIAVVGIGGGVPSSEVSLGDVVVAVRLADPRVQALRPDQLPELELRGERVHKGLADLLANLHASELGGWAEPDAITVRQPAVPLDDARFEGCDDAMRDKLRAQLHARFAGEHARTTPRRSLATIASSDALVRDPAVIAHWLAASRKIQTFEMEAAGVFEAAARIDATYPVLVVRGTSDVIGYRRDDAWTTYACHTAASFLIALIRSGRLASLRPMVTSPDVILMQDAGNFPTFINVIADELNAVTRGTIFIACDYAGYGMFSAGKLFDRYFAALRAARDRGCTIKVILDGTLELRRQLQEHSDKDDAGFERLMDGGRFADDLTEFGARMVNAQLTAPASRSRVEWLRALEAMELHYQDQLRQLARLAVTPVRIPVHMWITESRAIWALCAQAPKARFQMTVHMKDEGLTPDDGELPWAEYAYVSDDKRFVNRLRQLWRSYESEASPGADTRL